MSKRIMLKEFYNSPFFWHLFDSIVFGLIIGVISNHLHHLDLLDLNFILLSTIIRITISSYQLNRFYKYLKTFNVFFIINFFYVSLLSLFSNIFLNYKVNLFDLLIIIILSYIISLILYKISELKNFVKFLISYYFRVSIFFSGLFFDPSLLFGEYKFILYFNPLYWFYLIFI
jgi:hypothetical protein